MHRCLITLQLIPRLKCSIYLVFVYKKLDLLLFINNAYKKVVCNRYYLNTKHIILYCIVIYYSLSISCRVDQHDYFYKIIAINCKICKLDIELRVELNKLSVYVIKLNGNFVTESVLNDFMLILVVG